jgi:hypothetical protein
MQYPVPKWSKSIMAWPWGFREWELPWIEPFNEPAEQAAA